MRTSKMILAVLAIGLIRGVAFGEDSVDGNKIDAEYKKLRVENRAKYFGEREAKGATVYEKNVYVDDEDLRQISKDLEDKKTNNISIASPTIEADSKVRKVNVVVDAKRDVTFQSTKSYAIDSKESERADIGVTKLEKGSRVKEVNTIIDTKDVVIDNDSKNTRRGVRVTPKADEDKEKSDE